MKKINYKKKIKKLIKSCKKIFSWKKWKKTKSSLFLNNLEQQSFIKKRKTLNLKFDFLTWPKFIKKHYIPYFSILLAIIFFILAFICLWPIFKVSQIEIIKKENITSMDRAYKAVEKYRWESIFKIKKDDILVQMKSYQENIKDIEINIDIPNVLNIDVESYPALFNTTINEKNYLILSNWTLVPYKLKEDIKNLVVIKDFDKNNFLSYKKIFNEKYINKIDEIIKKLEENIINIEVQELTYYVLERELHIDITNNTKLIFSIHSKDNIEEQIKKAVIFNKEHKDITLNEIIYIDFRIPNKIFYCDVESEFLCRNNLKSIYSDE